MKKKQLLALYIISIIMTVGLILVECKNNDAGCPKNGNCQFSVISQASGHTIIDNYACSNDKCKATALRNNYLNSSDRESLVGMSAFCNCN